MVEITRICTLEITSIEKGEVEDIVSKEKAKTEIEKNMKEMLDVDDVKVTNIQDFIRDIETGEQNER